MSDAAAFISRRAQAITYGCITEQSSERLCRRRRWAEVYDFQTHIDEEVPLVHFLYLKCARKPIQSIAMGCIR